jgi:hypothetical protein
MSIHNLGGPLLFAGLLTAGCATLPEVRDDAPVLCRLATRDRVLTVYAAGAPMRFAVHASDGTLLAEGADPEALRQLDPSLFRIYREAVAGHAPRPLLAD